MSNFWRVMVGGLLMVVGAGLIWFALHDFPRRGRPVHVNVPTSNFHVTAGSVAVPVDLKQEVERLRKVVEDERELRKAMQRDLAIEKRCRQELSDAVDVLRDLRRDLAARIEALEKKEK